jgi:CheY-like chemotaxis protein
MKPLKILIVDDDEITHKLLKIFLNQFDVIVHDSYDGFDAIKKTIVNDYGFILMDVRMPIMNGNESSKSIKEFKPEIPIYSISAYNFNFDKYDGLYEGYIKKPINHVEIYDIFDENGWLSLKK